MIVFNHLQADAKVTTLDKNIEGQMYYFQPLPHTHADLVGGLPIYALEYQNAYKSVFYFLLA